MATTRAACSDEVARSGSAVSRRPRDTGLPTQMTIEPPVLLRSVACDVCQ